MGKPNNSTSNDPSDNKHEQKLQAVILADTYCNAFHPVTLETWKNDTAEGGVAGTSSSKHPFLLTPLNNTPLLHHTIDFLIGSGVEELYILCGSGGEALEEYIQNYARGSNTFTSGENDGGGGAGSVGGASTGGKITWSSKLTIHVLRETIGLTNAGDALRELDRRNVIKSDPFLLLQGDVVTNVNVAEALMRHGERRKKESSAIMTVLLKEVGGWGSGDDVDDAAVENEENVDPNATTVTNPAQISVPPLRSSTDDLLLALAPTIFPSSDSSSPSAPHHRILLWDNHPTSPQTSLPTSFFSETSSTITLTRSYLDIGLDICSPDVLARFSDEFDYRDIRAQFVANSVAEEEAGLQSRIYVEFLKGGEYAGRVGDWRRWHGVSLDLLRRWCYPLVPDRSGGGNYVCERHLVYRHAGKEKDGSHVGRTTQLCGPLLLGPNNFIGEHCHLQKSTMGPNCTISSHCLIVNSHLFSNVTIESHVEIDGAVICDGAVIKKGAILERGCVVGKGCMIGEGVRLKEFTRITLAGESLEEYDDYSGFDESESEEISDDSEENGLSYESDDEEKDESKGTVSNAPFHDYQDITDHDIVGKGGLGRVWTPPPLEDYDSEDEDNNDDDGNVEDNGHTKAKAAALELMKSQSIGYDIKLIYQKWKQLRMEEDDQFSEEGLGSDDHDEYDNDGMGMGGTRDINVMGMNGMFDNGVNMDPSAASTSHLDAEGLQITGRQKGVDVIKELRDICLEHETSSPVENLRIELNSFKFSQNATYGDCCKGAMMAVMWKIVEQLEDNGDNPSPGKLVLALRKMLEYWGPLMKSICMGSEEEKAIICVLETMALGGGGGGSGSEKKKAASLASILGTEPSFRFVLQTLHDIEIVNEDAIFQWAQDRKGEGRETPRGTLFHQKPTQDFLEWLEEDSSDEDGEEESGSSGEDSF